MLVTNEIGLSNNLDKIMDFVLEHDEPVKLTTKKGNTVLIREDEYRSLLESVYLISHPRLVEKIEEGEKGNVTEMTIFSVGEEW